MPLMLLFQVHKNFLPVFLIWLVWSEPIYYSIYLEIFVGTRTYRCCVALPVLNVGFLCVRLFVSLCFSCAFALCFWHVKLGKTYCKSLTVPWVFEVWEAGFCSEPASPTFPQSGLPCGEGDKEIYMVSGRLSPEINLLYHPTPSPSLVPTVLYPCEVLC